MCGKMHKTHHSSAETVFQENQSMYVSLLFQDPVEMWPLCDCLVAFHSKGFPLEKSISYAQLRRPYIINNLEMQFDIQDRRSVYQILEREGIELPRYAILDREDPESKCSFLPAACGMVRRWVKNIVIP